MTTQSTLKPQQWDNKRLLHEVNRNNLFLTLETHEQENSVHDFICLYSECVGMRRLCIIEVHITGVTL